MSYNDDSILTVEGSAAALDEIMPGWHKRVDTEVLSMWSERDCIIGQTFPQAEFGDVLTRYNLWSGAFSGAKTLWVKEIEKRRAMEEAREGTRVLVLSGIVLNRLRSWLTDRIDRLADALTDETDRGPYG